MEPKWVLYLYSQMKVCGKSYIDVNNGPVKIINTDHDPIIGAERVIYNVNVTPTSFSDMMAPDSQLDKTYWMPWYNNVDLDTQLRFGNVSDSLPRYMYGLVGTRCSAVVRLRTFRIRMSYLPVRACE